MATAELSRREAVNRILRQPHGVEGFARVGQHIPNDLAASQRENAPGERIYSRRRWPGPEP